MSPLSEALDAPAGFAAADARHERRTVRAARGVVTLAVAATVVVLGGVLAAGCSFRPRVPDAVVSCAVDSDCPEDLICQPKLQRCCRAGSCQDPPSSNPTAGRDAGRPPTGDTAAASPADAAPEAEPAPPVTDPPAADPGDAGTSDAGNSDAGDGASALAPSCSGTATVPTFVTSEGRKSYCTIFARATDVSLAIHSMVPGDAVSTRTYGLCSAPLPLLQEATDPTSTSGGGRAIGATSAHHLRNVVAQYKAICERHNAEVVGVTANAWARLATNRAELSSELAKETGLALDVPTSEAEWSQFYLGVTRQRRGRVIVYETTRSIDVAYWPKDATAATWVSLPLGWTDLEAMYVANQTHATFEDARRALRGRLVRELESSITTLRTLIAAGKLEPGFTVGPADATIPLAVRGGLRDARGTWDGVTTFQKKRSEAPLTPSPYGRIFGTAPLAPGEIDGFFGTLDDVQWRQLRSDPLRTAYGYELFYVTVVLDVLADETKASEFAFVYTSNHLGYLFAKVLPPPS